MQRMHVPNRLTDRAAEGRDNSPQREVDATGASSLFPTRRAWLTARSNAAVVTMLSNIAGGKPPRRLDRLSAAEVSEILRGRRPASDGLASLLFLAGCKITLAAWQHNA